MLNAIKHRLAFAFLYPEELIELVDLCTDIFTGLEAHHDELAILRRIQDRAERRVPLRCLLDVLDVAFHSFLIPSLGLVGRIWPKRNPPFWSELYEQHKIVDDDGNAPAEKHPKEPRMGGVPDQVEGC